MMWGTIANLKQNLHKIALDVHDDDEEDNNDDVQIYASSVNGGGEASPVKDSPVSARRNSRRFALSSSPSSLRSPVANGGGVSPEIEQYRAEIKRVQDSEAEIKALAKNYAALLKEKEDQISRLSKENGSLKQNLDTTTAPLNASRIEIHKAAANGTNLNKGGTNMSPNHQQRSAGQAKTSYSGHQRQNGINHTQDGNGMTNGIAHISDMQGNERESEESEKMDEDRKVIEELRQDNEHLRSQIFHMEKALKKAIASQEDVKMFNNNKLQKSKQLIDDLNKRLESSMSTIDAKNMELLNLQTALGQYYAEIEAKVPFTGTFGRIFG